MAKRDNRNKMDKGLKTTIIRNWIICGVSLLLIIILYALAGRFS